MTVAQRVFAETIAEVALERGYSSEVLGRMSDRMWVALAASAGVPIAVPMEKYDARLCGVVVDLVMAEEEAERVAHL